MIILVGLTFFETNSSRPEACGIQRERGKQLEKKIPRIPENPESIQYFPTTQVNVRELQSVLLHVCVHP